MTSTADPISAGPGASLRRAGPASTGSCPSGATLIADTVTPVGAFLQVVGDEPGFLLESVEHGERWGRFPSSAAIPWPP